MSDYPPDILILSPDDSTASRCSEWIDDFPCHVFLPKDPIPDIFPSNVGVIEISSPNSANPDFNADVRLPLDVSRRELRMVCRLLLEIVQLRRSLRSADKLGRNFKKAALTDPLTELPNRRDWHQSLENRLCQARPSRPLCLAVIDLDHFKRVNSSHGHAVGDQVLKLASASIRGSLRGDDFVARLGGDEFGLLFWAPSQRVAAEIVDRARTAIEKMDIDELFRGQSDETAQKITASAGFCMSTGCISAEKIYDDADTAMREAKRLGRNRTVGGE